MNKLTRRNFIGALLAVPVAATIPELAPFTGPREYKWSEIKFVVKYRFVGGIIDPRAIEDFARAT